MGLRILGVGTRLRIGWPMQGSVGYQPLNTLGSSQAWEDGVFLCDQWVLVDFVGCVLGRFVLRRWSCKLGVYRSMFSSWTVCSIQSEGGGMLGCKGRPCSRCPL
jgi:hypothetical protein